MRAIAFLIVLGLLAGCAAPEAEPSSAPDVPPPSTAVGSPTPGAPATTTPIASPTPTPQGSPSPMPPQRPSPGRFAGCAGTGPVDLTVAPMRAEDYEMILPYGLLAGAHVTPIDHMYFSPPQGSVRDQFEVRAMADGVIYSVQPRDIFVDTGAARAREWRMDIAHTCTFTTYYDLLTSLDPSIEAEYNKTQGGRSAPWTGIPVKAGQVVGRIGAQTLDWGAYDYNVTLPGFIVPEHYDRESWKVHTVDPFPHFVEPVRSELLAKVIRQAEPRAGKIDHDIDGKLQGNWFEVGTNGYAGRNPATYWDTHLSFVPDYLDWSQVRVGVGNFSGRGDSFGVKGNAPAPANVTTASGIVEYELVRFEHYARNNASRVGMAQVRPGDDVAARNLDQVQGVVLAQMMEPRIVKIEVFPGKTAAEVEGFTPAARLYER